MIENHRPAILARHRRETNRHTHGVTPQTDTSVSSTTQSTTTREWLTPKPAKRTAICRASLESRSGTRTW